MAAQAAALSLRELDSAGSIAIVGEESHPPYSRPPLSKSLWSGRPLESVWLNARIDDLTLHLGRKAVEWDPARRVVTDQLGDSYSYEKLLLATGARPRRLPFPIPEDRVTYYRGLDDFERLRGWMLKPGKVAVIGGGLLGTELAASLLGVGKQVVLIAGKRTLCGGRLPRDLAEHVTQSYRNHGAEVLSGQEAIHIEARGEGIRIVTSSGHEVEATSAVVAVGATPRTELAERAGLEVDDGIVVNEGLETSAEGAYAAGDVARFRNPFLGERIRVEHEDNALEMGRCAGRALSGARSTYLHLPFYSSQLASDRYEAVGELDDSLEVVEDWRREFEKGVVYYLREGARGGSTAMEYQRNGGHCAGGNRGAGAVWAGGFEGADVKN